MFLPLKKSSVNKNRTFGSKMRGKIGYLGGEKEMWRVGREIFINHDHE
jgi:hypothetical protein